MILLSALVLGLLAGWGWARWQRRPYQVPDLKSVWLIPAALVPQVAAAYIPGLRSPASLPIAAGALPLSLLVFLVFVWLNRRLPGMPVLLAGLILNLVVISANGGWMPISPKTASQLPAGEAIELSSPGTRFGQKDVVLRPEDTRFEFLSDRFLTPDWFHYPVAFSLGDVLVAIGAFWLLARGAPVAKPNRSEE